MDVPYLDLNIIHRKLKSEFDMVYRDILQSGWFIHGKYCEIFEKEFAAYVGKCKELALYDTGVTAEYGDKLITLSTCEYSAQNGRLVVVAKKVN